MITPTEQRILSIFLESNDPLALKELTKVYSVLYHNLHKNFDNRARIQAVLQISLDELVRKGYILKDKSSGRRRYSYSLTKEGIKQLASSGRISFEQLHVGLHYM